MSKNSIIDKVIATAIVTIILEIYYVIDTTTVIVINYTNINKYLQNISCFKENNSHTKCFTNLLDRVCLGNKIVSLLQSFFFSILIFEYCYELYITSIELIVL